MLGLVNILSILTDKIKSFEMVNIRVGLMHEIYSSVLTMATAWKESKTASSSGCSCAAWPNHCCRPLVVQWATATETGKAAVTIAV